MIIKFQIIKLCHFLYASYILSLIYINLVYFCYQFYIIVEKYAKDLALRIIYSKNISYLCLPLLNLP